MTLTKIAVCITERANLSVEAAAWWDGALTDAEHRALRTPRSESENPLISRSCATGSRFAV